MIANIERADISGTNKPEVRDQVIDPTLPILRTAETLAMQELYKLGLEITKNESFLNTTPTGDPIAIETAYLQVLNTDPSQINFNDPETQNLIFGDTSTQILLEDSSKIIQVITASEQSDKVGKFSLSLQIGSLAGADAEGVIIQETHPDNTITYYIYDSTNALITPVTLPEGEKLGLFTRHEDNGFDRLVPGVSKGDFVYVLTSSGFIKEDSKNFSTTANMDGLEPWQQGSTISAVNLRSDPSSNAAIIEVLPKGTSVFVMDRERGSDAAYYKVITDGKIGRVRSDLLTEIQQLSITGLEKVIINKTSSYVFDGEEDLVLDIPKNSSSVTIPENTNNSSNLLTEATFRQLNASELSPQILNGIEFRPTGAKSNWIIQSGIPGLNLDGMNLTDVDMRLQRMIQHYPLTNSNPESISNPLNSTKEIVCNYLVTPQEWLPNEFGGVVERNGIIDRQITIDDSDPDKTFVNIYLNPTLFTGGSLSRSLKDYQAAFLVNNNLISLFYTGIAGAFLDPSLRRLTIDPVTPIENIILTQQELNTGSWAGLISANGNYSTDVTNVSISATYNRQRIQLGKITGSIINRREISGLVNNIYTQRMGAYIFKGQGGKVVKLNTEEEKSVVESFNNLFTTLHK